jgi:hypothetical protein
MELAQSVGVEQHGASQPNAAGDPRRWVEAWAEHVRKRFNGRAVVSARIAGAAPVVLSQVYALEGCGLVLVTPCEHEAGGPADDDAAHERDAASVHDHEHGSGAADAHAEHPHEDLDGCCGDCEFWLASPAQVAFESRSAAEGTLCTGFGYLGLSRTPHVFVARGREAPPRRGHHEHG